MMAIYKVQDSSMIAPLFVNNNKRFIHTYLQNYMGNGYVDNLQQPQSGFIQVGCFSFFAGIPNDDLISDKPHRYKAESVIMVPPDQHWQQLIERRYHRRALKITRYQFQSNTRFDLDKLNTIIAGLPKHYRLQMIDKKRYTQILSIDWANDLCANFNSYAQFEKLGLGVVVLKENMIVSGASSYLVYKKGIEVEIDTKEEERRQGLALVCAAKLILESLKRNIFPNRDAHNIDSCNLAKKLGYHFDKHYPAYLISGF